MYYVCDDDDDGDDDDDDDDDGHHAGDLSGKRGAKGRAEVDPMLLVDQGPQRGKFWRTPNKECRSSDRLPEIHRISKVMQKQIVDVNRFDLSVWN